MVCKNLFYLLKTDEATKAFIRHNKKTWSSWKVKEPKSTLLFYFHNISETLISDSYFVNLLAKKHQAKIMAFTSRKKKLLDFLYFFWRKKIYASFNAGTLLIPRLNKEQKKQQENITAKLCKKIKNKRDILGIKVMGVPIGIPIYETYLLRYRQPTIKLEDPRLKQLIKEAVGLLLFYIHFMKKNKVAAVVATHDCFIYEDVLCRLAYKKKIPVYLPNVRGITYAKKPHSTATHFVNYPRMFKGISQQEKTKGIRWAKKQLQRKFRGEVGVDMPYAIKSAFKAYKKNQRPVLKKTKNIKVLICTHCFYDNPYAFGPILFVDFFEWLRFLGKVSQKTNYDWYLKVHPDYLPGTMEVIQKIVTEFPKIQIVSHRTSHHQLAREGIDFTLTVYGSVGHEHPALGVQVVNAGYNPRIAYDFNYHPKSIREYRNLLLNLGKIKDKSKTKIKLSKLYEYYYMRLNFSLADDLVFKSYRQLLVDLTVKERMGSRIYQYFLSQQSKVKHKQIINRMTEFINSNKQHYFKFGPA